MPGISPGFISLIFTILAVTAAAVVVVVAAVLVVALVEIVVVISWDALLLADS